MRVVLRVACVFTGISKFGCMLFDLFAVSVSLFYSSVSSAYFAHFVAHFISSRVVYYLDLYLHYQYSSPLATPFQATAAMVLAGEVMVTALLAAYSSVTSSPWS